VLRHSDTDDGSTPDCSSPPADAQYRSGAADGGRRLRGLAAEGSLSRTLVDTAGSVGVLRGHKNRRPGADHVGRHRADIVARDRAAMSADLGRANDAIWVVDLDADRIIRGMRGRAACWAATLLGCMERAGSRRFIRTTWARSERSPESGVHAEPAGPRTSAACARTVAVDYRREILAWGVPFDGQHAIVAMVRDVSARKAAEQALRRSDKRFRALAEKGGAWFLLAIAVLAIAWTGGTAVAEEVTLTEPWPYPECQPGDDRHRLATGSCGAQEPRYVGPERHGDHADPAIGRAGAGHPLAVNDPEPWSGQPQRRVRLRRARYPTCTPTRSARSMLNSAGCRAKARKMWPCLDIRAAVISRPVSPSSTRTPWSVP
jgi:PAS domain-containing protein